MGHFHVLIIWDIMHGGIPLYYNRTTLCFQERNNFMWDNLMPIFEDLSIWFLLRTVCVCVWGGGGSARELIGLPRTTREFWGLLSPGKEGISRIF